MRFLKSSQPTKKNGQSGHDPNYSSSGSVSSVSSVSSVVTSHVFSKSLIARLAQV